MMKRSQAAMEFLTTYGWAFLVILIMIGALSYFGILNPRDLLPERCNFGSEFQCVDFVLDSGDPLLIKLNNNIGEPIAIDAFDVSSKSTNVLDCSNGGSLPTDPSPWGAGDEWEFDYDCNGGSVTWAQAGFTAGKKGKIYVDVTYHTVKSGSGYPHVVKGEIFGTVQ